jgi:DNA-binding NarL/FixJ family response regulator
VIDYHLPGADGIAVAEQLRRVLPHVQVVMLTGRDDDSILRMAMEAGCAGFVTKDRATEDLVAAVRTVREGNAGLSAAAVHRLAGAPASAASRQYGLTARELDVLRLLTEGASTRGISEQLFISLNTARNHVQRIIRKLGAHSRLEAVAIATRAGLVRTERG